MMKRINRRISTVACAVAVLTWICAPVQAEFYRNLKTTSPVTVEFTSSGSNAGATHVAVYYLGRGLDVEAVFEVPPGTAFAQECLKPSLRVKRIIVEIDPPVGGQGVLRVSQGASVEYETQVLGSGRFVFGVVL